MKDLRYQTQAIIVPANTKFIEFAIELDTNFDHLTGVFVRPREAVTIDVGFRTETDLFLNPVDYRVLVPGSNAEKDLLFFDTYQRAKGAKIYFIYKSDGTKNNETAIDIVYRLENGSIKPFKAYNFQTIDYAFEANLDFSGVRENEITLNTGFTNVVGFCVLVTGEVNPSLIAIKNDSKYFLNKFPSVVLALNASIETEKRFFPLSMPANGSRAILEYHVKTDVAEQMKYKVIFLLEKNA